MTTTYIPLGGLGTGGYGSSSTGKLAVATGEKGGGFLGFANVLTYQSVIPIKPLPISGPDGTNGYAG